MNDVSAVLSLLDKHTPNSVLSRIGLSPDQVRSATRVSEPLSPEEVRRATIRSTRKMAYGSKGLPPVVVRQMYADYRRLGSCQKVAKLYGRSRQAVFEVFKNHNCDLTPKTFKAKLHYGGKDYTFDSGRDRHCYWRETKGKREPLHHRIWFEAGYTLPAGHELTFRDGDGRNYKLSNLEVVRKGTSARRRQRERRRAA